MEDFDDMLCSGEQGLNKGVQNAIVDLVERVYKHSSSKSKETLDKLRLKFTTKFTEYLVQTATRCRKVKTLISRTEPINIEDAYVRVSFTSGTASFPEDTLIERLCKGEQFVISGIAGSGKSMTMRYLYLTLCSKQFELIPVFLELRHVGFRNNQDVISYIIEQIANFTHSIERKAFLSSLKDCRFIFLFDGFDEIAIEMRDRAERDILQIAEKFPLCPIVVSSRPDSRFQRWHTFTEAKICPLSIEQLAELIFKTKYNEATKTNFTRKIKDGLYRSHKELLSNPLLATMMLMTFEEFAEIPSKMHIFYRSAFEVLFRRHDATKVDFHREFKTDLSIDDFEKVFSTFCLMSHLDSVHSFSNNANIIKYIAKAIQYEGVSVSSDNFRDDMTDNICIVLHDGEQFAFLHRSFQEYFSAVFLASRSVEAFADIVDAVARTDFNLAVIRFLFEMNREAIERNYVIPRLKSVISVLKQALGSHDVSSALEFFFSSVFATINDRQMNFLISMNEVPQYFQVFNILNDLYKLRLFPQRKLGIKAFEYLNQKGDKAGHDRISMEIKNIAVKAPLAKELEQYAKDTLGRLEDFLLKKIQEEAGRKTLLSEALLGSKQK